ncbi:MAG TPA: ABC transporter permease [Devosia sp.]|nr:ABC transporter permease [Devosia sp.]
MSSSFFLAIKYLKFHWLRSAVLCVAMALIVMAPLTIQLLLSAIQQQLTSRADDTPLLLGARGSTLDLTIGNLYFAGGAVPLTSMAAAEEVWNSGLGNAIPLYARFSTGGVQIVGTSFDYFDYRHLTIADGRGLAVLGEAVVGAEAARKLGVAPGDRIISSPENLFDLGGVYPLRMSVVGILAPTGTPDDDVAFVDIKTSWVIEGIGHGHTAQVAEAPSSDAPVSTYNEITDSNLDSFHFHGAAASYPLTGVIVAPEDERAATILMGRYLDADARVQVIRPSEVVAKLLGDIFRISSVLDAVVAAIACAALLSIALAIFLSLQLRRDEIDTIARLGARKSTVVRVVSAELIVLFAASLALAAAGTALFMLGKETLVLWLLK